MKLIPLTQDKFTQVDDEDYDFLIQWRWFAHPSRNKWRAQRTDYKPGNAKTILMHRVIMKIENSKTFVDHIDGNPLNNQKSNLRLCDNSQNCRNRKSHDDVTSKYLGVCKQKNSWIASICHNKESIYLGSYKTEELAAKAYDKKAIELHGEFANLNFK